MEKDGIYSEKIEKIQKDILKASSQAQTVKLELLKHYLTDLVLYKNLPDFGKTESPIRVTLTKLSILLEKLVKMESKINSMDSRQVLKAQLMKTKNNAKVSKVKNDEKIENRKKLKK